VKRIQDQTLYEILEVAPAAALFEIEAAYARAKSLYGPGSLATYTLMEPEESQRLVGRIEEAGRVLLDAEARARYDATLVAPTAAAAPTTTAPNPASTLLSAAAPVNGERRAIAPVVIPALSLARTVFAEDGAGPDDEDVEADDVEALEGEALEGEAAAESVAEAAELAAPPAVAAAPEAEAPVTPAAVAAAPEPDAPPTLAATPASPLPPAPPPEASGPAVAAEPAEVRPVPPLLPALAELPSPTALSVEAIAPAAQLLAAAAAAGGPAEASSPPVRTPIPLRNEVAVTPPPEPVPAPPRAAEPPRETNVVVPEGTAWTGDVLRQIREARGLSLKTLAERTRVTRHHIENIEGDRFKLLPAPVYLRGILMTLARELRLDGQKVAKSYLERASRPG
jgi:hypothetical protein